MAKKKTSKKKKTAPESKKLKKVKKKHVQKKKVKKIKSLKKKTTLPKKLKKEKAKKEPVVKPVKPAKEVREEKPQDTPQQIAAKEAALAKARAKALAKARLKLKEKERQNTPAQPVDQKAYEKQQKLAEPKHKLVLEYIIHASLSLLYDFITTPSGMSEWFADDVNISGTVYSFVWEGSKQDARLLAIKENKSVRFQWVDRAPNTYFEFRIDKNELTEELSLIITDFAESQDEMNSLEVLWQGQIQRLMKVIGSKV